MFDFRLQVFCSVARNLSFTKASHELHITQPAISKHIQELEQEYDTLLFNRLNNRIELTPAGELLLVHARQIMDRYRQLDFDMRMLSHNLDGELRLGASSSIAQYILPEFMATFSAKFKNIKLSLFSGSIAEIEKAVEEKRIDLGVVETIDRKKQLRYMPFMHSSLLLVAPSSSRWAALDEITIEELKFVPLVVGTPGMGGLEVMQSVLGTYGIGLDQLNIIMQLSSYEGIMRYMQHADSMAVMSSYSAMNEIAKGRLKAIDIKGLEFDCELSFVRNQGETLPVAKDFISYIQECLRYK